MSMSGREVLEHLRGMDRELHLASLYLPENYRDDIATIWAFDAEIRRIPSLVSEAIPGEIRIQWWRDLLKSGNNAGAGPLAGALMDVIEKHALPRETLDDYLEARIFDLYNDPMPDMGSFEGYLGETVSVMFRLAAQCAGAQISSELADACGHAGMARGAVTLLANVSRHRSRQQIYFPLETITSHGLDQEGWLSASPTTMHDAVMAEMVSLAQFHMTTAAHAVRRLPPEFHSVFLPLSFSAKLLDRIRRNPGACLIEPAILSPLSLQWIAFRAALRGGI